MWPVLFWVTMAENMLCDFGTTDASACSVLLPVCTCLQCILDHWYVCSGVCSAVSPSLCWFAHSTLFPLYLSTPEGNWCSGAGKDPTHQQHTCAEGSLLAFCSVVPKGSGPKPPCTLGAGVLLTWFVVFLFGLEITGSSVISSLLF